SICSLVPALCALARITVGGACFPLFLRRGRFLERALDPSLIGRRGRRYRSFPATLYSRAGQAETGQSPDLLNFQRAHRLSLFSFKLYGRRATARPFSIRRRLHEQE